MPARLPFAHENLGEQMLKGFERTVGSFAATLADDQQLPQPDTDSSRARAVLADSPQSLCFRSPT
jgi:hypothetical protein